MNAHPSSLAETALPYRARDLLLPPGLISLSRVVLAGCFPIAVRSPRAAIGVLLPAALTDVLDGWVARRLGLVTPAGAVLDGVTDKIFVITVAATLVANHRLSPGAVLLLGARELGEAPLVAWFASLGRSAEVRAQRPSANAPGKLATVLQFATVSWAVARGPHLAVLTAATAIAGAVAAAGYWRRAWRSLARGSRAHPAARVRASGRPAEAPPRIPS